METILDKDNCLVVIYRNWINSEWTKTEGLDAKRLYEICVEKCTNRRIKNYGDRSFERPRLTYGCADDLLVGTEYPHSEFILDKWIPEIEYLSGLITKFYHETLGYVIYLDSCMINGYVKPTDYIYPHMDREALGINKPVVTLSLGSSRNLKFRWSTENKSFTVPLNDGDLLLMYGDTNRKLTHEIKPVSIEENKYEPRYSLTFRVISPLTEEVTDNLQIPYITKI